MFKDGSDLDKWRLFGEGEGGTIRDAMNPFAHFILTRFNVPLRAKGAPAEPSGVEAKWLARRFDLFARVCVPSVARQTVGEFQWLVFMDWATPVGYKERMAALAVRHDFLRPIYGSEFLPEIVLEEIRRREPAGRVRVTTRLDSDDAIHPRLIERVQEKAREYLPQMNLAHGFWISFPFGCCERKGDFYLVHEPVNPFMSFVSAPESAQTALERAAGEAAESAPVVTRIGRPLWCQVIHGDNRSATVRGVYWPWGGSSEFAPGISNGFRRSWAWQCAEVVRSAAACRPGRRARS